jgi:SAM-dependent methyltransferase
LDGVDVRSCIRLPNRQLEPLSAELAHEEVRFPPELVRAFLEEHTKPDDVVFDPFGGYGTVLTVAEEMGRRGCGIELDAARHAYACSRLRRPETFVLGDARQLETYGLPQVDFCMTGIPFCTQDETADPLTWYTAPGGGYAAYLADLQEIFRQVGRVVRPGANVVIEVANLRDASSGTLTPLAWDVARSVGQVLRFEREIVVDWEPTYGHGYDHSYCLVFRAAG